MSVKAVFFDLDGTLLPMDLEVYTKAYFKLIAAELAPLGIDTAGVMAMLNDGIEAMAHNDGSRKNFDAFWQRCAAHYDAATLGRIEARMNAFYLGSFRRTAEVCTFDPRARIAVETAAKKGFLTVLATNPVFPSVATEIRMGFVGLTPRDFCYVTTYENSRFCKPNPGYYRDIAEKLGLSPAECAMVGNDTREDLAAADIGMAVFLMTDHIVDRKDRDYTAVPQGGFNELIAWIKSL